MISFTDMIEQRCSKKLRIKEKIMSKIAERQQEKAKLLYNQSSYKGYDFFNSLQKAQQKYIEAASKLRLHLYNKKNAASDEQTKQILNTFFNAQSIYQNMEQDGDNIHVYNKYIQNYQNQLITQKKRECNRIQKKNSAGFFSKINKHKWISEDVQQYSDQDCQDSLINHERSQRGEKMEHKKYQRINQNLPIADNYENQQIKEEAKRQNNNDEQKQLEQNAEIAMHFVAEICKQNQDEPLMLRLINIEVEGVDRKLLDRKKQMFTRGVILDHAIFTQRRVSQALIKQNKQQLFRFYPTSTVTSPIFNRINSRERSDKILIFGPYGISKTTSIILYHHLSSQINKYLYLTTEEKRVSFIRKWSKRKVEVPNKIFYWSINLNEEQKDVIQILRKQCPQLDIPTQINSIIQFRRSIIEAYKSKEMRCDVVIDQINTIASAYRKQNMLNQKHSPSKEFKKAKTSFDYCDQIIVIATLTYGNYYFNSPVNIEEQLLSKPKGDFTHTLNLNNHTDITKFEVKYSKLIGKQVSQQQIDLIIAIEIVKALSVGAVSRVFQKKRNELIRQQIFEQKMLAELITELRGNTKWEFYVRPLNIFQTVKGYIFQNRDQISKQMLEQDILEIIQILREKSRKCIVEKIQNFLRKGKRSQSRKKLISLIYVKVLQQIKQKGTDANQIVEIPKNLVKQFQEEDFDKQMFAKKTQNVYEMVISLKQFQEVFSLVSFSEIISEQLFYLLERYFNDGQSGRNMFGRIVEDSFTKYLKTKINQSQIKIRIITSQRKTINITLKDVSQFTHLNVQSGSVYNHMENLVELCWGKLKENEYILGLPQTAANQPSQRIDFLMMNIFEGVIKIYSFDFATGKTNIEKKLTQPEMKGVIQGIKKQKSLFAKDGQVVKQIQWQHFVVVSPYWVKCQKNKNRNKNKNKNKNKNTYLYQWISFEQLLIVNGCTSKDRQIFQKGVELMIQEAK